MDNTRRLRMVGYLSLVALGAAWGVGCDSTASDGGGGLPVSTPGPSGPSTTPTPTPTPAPDDANSNGSPPDAPDNGPGTLSCALNADCDNGTFCDGEERCVNTHCQGGDDPCPSPFEVCDEATASCVPMETGCLSDDDCEDDEYCEAIAGRCQPVVTGNCGPGAGVCNIGNSSPGCEIQACCDDVCVIDPSCCFTMWDSECADLALTRSDCLASP